MLSQSALASLTITPLGLAWVGAAVLLTGEIVSLLALPNLKRVLIFSTLAEAGYVLIGLGIAGAAV